MNEGGEQYACEATGRSRNARATKVCFMTKPSDKTRECITLCTLLGVHVNLPILNRLITC